MSQPSEDRAPEQHEQHEQLEPPEQPAAARVLPFERGSELQRAVQQRAVESMERQRAQASRRPNPMRRVATFALALIPVALLWLGVDALLRVFHHINDLYNSPEANAAVAAPSEPAVEVSEPQPGVVLLQPLEERPKNPPALER